MSSLVRRIEKKLLKKRKEWPEWVQPVKNLPCGGYITLHPTNGYRKVSGKRVALRIEGD